MQRGKIDKHTEGLTHRGTFRGSARFCSSYRPQKQNKEESGEVDEGRWGGRGRQGGVERED